MFYENNIKAQIEDYCKENDYTITEFSITPISGTWHEGFKQFKLRYNQGYLTCCLNDMESGCGIMLFHNFIYSNGNTKAMLPILDILFNNTQEVGTVIATLGCDYNDENTLLAWGFEPILTYDNLAHDEGDTQTLYKKTIK